MLINNLIVENISNADEKFLKAFYKMINEIDSKIVKIINSKNVKIILANKMSDVFNSTEEKNKFKTDLEIYKEYNTENCDEISHGVCSNTINAICLFSNTTEISCMEGIFYHETGHFIDFNETWENEDIKGVLSTKKEFVDAYIKDITKHWEEIQKDKRFRLIHYIEDSTPEKASETGLAETFAFCFAVNNGKIDDVNIISDYFHETLSAAKKITDEYLMNKV